MKTGKFVLFQSDKNREFYWHLKSANNEIILQSEGYQSKQSALEGIESVRNNAPLDERYERLDSKDGQYYFVLKAANGQVIGVSETYTTKANREVGIEAVKRIAPCAPIHDLTLSEEERKKQGTALGGAQTAGKLAIISPHCKETIPVKPKGGVYGQVHSPKTMTSFHPYRQVSAFQRLQKAGFISELKMQKGMKKRFHWSFRMGAFSFQFDEEQIPVDFCQYRLKVTYSDRIPPRVTIIDPILPKDTKHLYKQGHLCLYKPTKWQWQDQHQFDEELFPDICSWLYHYEYWRDNGEWLGEEAEHDPPKHLIDNLLSRIYRN